MVWAFRDIGPRRSRRQTRSRPQAIDLECEGGACRHRGDTAAAGQDPLEHPLDEPSRRRLAEHGSTHLVEKRFEAVKTFKLSNDPKFEEKFWDVIGLYLDPPTKALVLCCDEKSQCQALERTQLGLPLAPKRMRTMTHDYMRHGTVTLFAALVQLTGTLIARTEVSHTHVEWLRFLKQIDRDTPPDLELHLIADNYATHKHPKVRAWLEKHPRFKMHFTPTSSSWLNLVERFFADLTGDVIRAGSFASVNELVRDIETYLAERNANPKPYKWKAEGAKILPKIKRARVALDKAEAA